MRIRFWGTRGTRPTPGRRTLRYGGNTACIEIRASETGAKDGSDLLIIDAGSGLAELGLALRTNGPVRAHLLVTHTHWDHIQGFPWFAPNFIRGSELTVLGPAGSAKTLQGAFADQMDPTYWPGPQMGELPAAIEFVELAAGVPVEVGPFRVIPHLLNHPIATFGYRVEESGRSFAFATDNEIPVPPGGALTPEQAAQHEALIQWCGGADLLVHDAQYSDDEYASKAGWGHSTFEAAMKLAEASEVDQLGFFHHDPAHSDAEVDALIEESLASHRWPRASRLTTFPAAEDQEIVL